MKTFMNNIFKTSGTLLIIYFSTLFIPNISANENQIIDIIHIDTVSPTIMSWSSLKLIATAIDQNGIVMDPNPSFTWTSDNPWIVEVDANGIIRWVSEWIATITATDWTVIWTNVVMVINEIQPQILSIIYVDTISPTIMSWSSLKLIATAIDQNGIVMDPNPSFTWTSDNPWIVEVDANGIIRWVSEWIATITATDWTVIWGNGVMVTSQESVSSTNLLIDTFDPIIYIWTDLQLIATTFDQNGIVTSSSWIIWASGNESVVTVDSSGIITWISEWTWTITAISDWVLWSVNVTVVPINQVSIPKYLFVDYYNPIIYSGASLQLISTIFDQNWVAINPWSEITWTSDNESVLTVDSSGIITWISEWTWTITATSDWISWFTQVTVNSALTANMHLFSWWNLVTLPINALDINWNEINFSAETFGDFAGADVVVRWINQSYESHVVNIPINDFPLENWIGYFIHVPSEKNITLTWTPYPQITPPTTQWWNLVWLNNVNDIDADTFGKSFSWINVVKFDSIKQEWNSHVVNFPLNNFLINRWDWVFIYKQ
ncbi:MAG: Ig domain protein group 2 protein [uncultured bacterium (gcode 4)]|uniref:Ig domain protein group 2 protein n=1 Tax=uncultured bacterium (gcode 4) TaxID=1234023 RepID=K2G915_9BACT|nr:MAG: Ig domain protein group 2 protein [uncultured bacterium (gcode 4)]